MRVTSAPEVTFELEGAHITIPSETIAAAWLDRLRDPPAPSTSGLPLIGTVVGIPGGSGTFMGLITGESLTPDTKRSTDLAVIDLGEAPTRMNFADATKWAEDKGGQLPTRRAQSLMFANRAKGQFKEGWYWSCEQYAGNSDYAWIQDFAGGGQHDGHKDYECFVRAVRMVDPSVIR